MELVAYELGEIDQITIIGNQERFLQRLSPLAGCLPRWADVLSHGTACVSANRIRQPWGVASVATLCRATCYEPKIQALGMGAHRSHFALLPVPIEKLNTQTTNLTKEETKESCETCTVIGQGTFAGALPALGGDEIQLIALTIGYCGHPPKRGSVVHCQ